MTDLEQVDFLLECSKNHDIEKWNNWREENPNLYINLCDANFENAYLTGVNLSCANLIGANFNKASLFRASLRRASIGYAKFLGSDLAKTDLYDASIFNADLRGANLSEADLRNANFKESVLFKVNLTRADLRKCDLSKTNLREANLVEADLREANLNEANLKEAFVYRAVLDSANLSRAKLGEAKLRGAKFNGADLTNADLKSADLRKVNLSSANLSSANLSSANLSDTDLTNSNLTNSILSSVILYRAKSHEAKLHGANLFNTAHEEWSINNVKCDYIFKDRLGQKRIPAKRNFVEREFEEWFKYRPSFQIPCENPQDHAFAAQIANVYNLKTDFREGLALKSIDVPTKSATFSIVKKENLDTVEAELIELRKQCLRLEGAKENSNDMVVMAMQKLLETNMINIDNNGTIGSIGHNSTHSNNQTVNSYYAPKENEVAVVENEIKTADISEDHKEVILDALKEYAKETGQGILKESIKTFGDVVRDYIPGIVIKAMPYLSAFLAGAVA